MFHAQSTSRVTSGELSKKMLYAQTVKEDLMFYAQSTSTVTSGTNLEGSDIKFANTVRNLGVCLDPTLSFQQQISSVCCMCYLELRQISAIHHYLSEDVTKKPLCAFVLSRLDYCNSLLAGCPKYLLSKFQNVQNNTVRLIFRTTRSAHAMLHSLHWLPIEQRVEYKFALL